MRADLALFFTTLAAIAIVGLIVRNHSGSAEVIGATTSGLTGLYGAVISGNPQFYNQAKGFTG